MLSKITLITKVISQNSTTRFNGFKKNPWSEPNEFKCKKVHSLSIENNKYLQKLSKLAIYKFKLW